MKQVSAPHFSPSEHHLRLMTKITPSLAYDGGDVKAWQRKLRKKLRELVGHMPAERVPLNVRSIWQREHPLGTIEKIVFRSEPYVDVPAYVCVPANARPPYIFMICLQGHSTGMHNSIAVQREDETQPLEVKGDRDFAIGCMRNGLAALCIEQRSLGERMERKDELRSKQGCRDAAMRSLMLGKTLIGERVWDVDRGIDYLSSRGDVDVTRVGVMGNSGGGTTTIYSAALLKRVAFALPSCSLCNFRDSIMPIPHCMDNYIPGILQYAEMGDILGLFAPKPVVVIAAENDEYFPLNGARKAYRDLKRIYQAAKAADRCEFAVGNDGHRFYAELAWPFMLKQLKKLKAQPK